MSPREFDWGGKRDANECIRAIKRVSVRLACWHDCAESLRFVQRARMESH